MQPALHVAKEDGRANSTQNTSIKGRGKTQSLAHDSLKYWDRCNQHYKNQQKQKNRNSHHTFSPQSNQIFKSCKGKVEKNLFSKNSSYFSGFYNKKFTLQFFILKILLQEILELN